MSDPVSIVSEVKKPDVGAKQTFVLEALPAVQSAGGFAMTPVIVRRVVEAPAKAVVAEAAPLPLPRVA